MIPKLGRIIYIIYKDSITRTTVYLKGKTSFAHAEAFDPMYVDEYREELEYDDYNKTWFTSLSAARKFLLKQYKNCKLVKVDTDYWELERKC